MLTNMKKELTNAYKNKRCIPQFNINNLEWTKYILEECQLKNIPVILGVSESTIKYIGGYKTVVNMIKGLIEDLDIKIPVSIHLDHGSSIESCKNAITAGFTSVMIDLSSEPIEKNIEITKELIKLSHPNVLVEAEIGTIGITKENKNYTTLENCKKLKETGIDLLAPAIGNKHGIYEGQANLDYELLEKINTLDIPLVLHGASGLSNSEIKKCIQKGIAKVNFNTDLQLAWHTGVKNYIEKNKEIYDPKKIIGSGEENIKTKISEKIELLK